MLSLPCRVKYAKNHTGAFGEHRLKRLIPRRAPVSSGVIAQDIGSNLGKAGK